MFNFLHTFQPQPVLISLGALTIYWYGFFIVLGILAAIITTLKLAKYYQIKSDLIFDLSFWLVIGGVAGARIYDVILFLPYYLEQPLAVFKVWEGGLAIHGGIIAGIIIIWIFSLKKKLCFWRLTAVIVPGLALAQALGRWGNYFNQELFGLPTALPWGIPIDIMNRPINHLSQQFFHPTFLYESIGNLVIFFILILTILYITKKARLNKHFFVLISALYMILYSILRFSLEFIRLDETPSFLFLRWPQIISVIIIILSILLLIFNSHASKEKK